MWDRLGDQAAERQDLAKVHSSHGNVTPDFIKFEARMGHRWRSLPRSCIRLECPQPVELPSNRHAQMGGH